MNDKQDTEQAARKRISEPLESAMRERLPISRTLSEQKTFVQLARGLSQLPSERSRAALEIAATLASINWRLSLDFLRAAPDAAKVLDADVLRQWSEIGKRLSVTDTERAAQFYLHGVEDLHSLSASVRASLFEVCTRQMRLRVQMAIETLEGASEIERAARRFENNEIKEAWLAGVYEVALEIARRSAKHSTDFLRATKLVTETVAGETSAPHAKCDVNAKHDVNAKSKVADAKLIAVTNADVARASLNLAREFAVCAGGIAADFWSSFGENFARLDNAQRVMLLESASEFLERGGAAALAIFDANANVLRLCADSFTAWLGLLREVATSGNANLVVLSRLAKPFFTFLAHRESDKQMRAELAMRVIEIVREIAAVDAESAINCLRSARTALAKSSLENFERWAREGIADNEAITADKATKDKSSNAKFAPGKSLNKQSLKDEQATESSSVAAPNHVADDNLNRQPHRPPTSYRKQQDARGRRSYYSLETRASNVALNEASAGLQLREVAHTLQLYVEALTGRAVEVTPLTAIPDEARIGDGRTLYLPAHVAEFEGEDLNFKLYKALAAHAAGQIEYGTRERATRGANSKLEAAYASIAELYAEDNINALDAFSLAGYIEDVTKGERALSIREERQLAVEQQKKMPDEADFKTLLALFPNRNLAARIFSTLENARIDRRLRHDYKGLRRDLDFVQARLANARPAIHSVPVTTVPFELLFQITLCGGATDDARGAYNQIVSELELIVSEYLSDKTSTVADTLMATSRVYALFQSVVPDASANDETNDDTEIDTGASEASSIGEMSDASRELNEPESKASRSPQDVRELFNQWASVSTSELDTYDALESDERWTNTGAPEQALEAGETAYFYDEWDRDLSDYRVAWCRVVEKKVKKGERNFVELARSRYRGLISSLRYQFQMMRPEGMRRVQSELDGDDYNLESVIDFVIDRRAARQARVMIQPNERLYTKRLRRERDVAVSFLLDQSSSTARTIGRNPLQPYTHPGRRIIEIEKEGLVLMSEALESVGDAYAIYGFTSEGRRNVRFYTIKDFDEHLTDEIERRIGGINFQHNTRLGAAIRHASAKLAAREARTHLLIILTDGRPYDHDYGDTVYAREDTRDALNQARIAGVTPFCITIDRNGEQELKDLYGDVGYTIIDDVLSLPERMPMIYRRLTT